MGKGDNPNIFNFEFWQSYQVKIFLTSAISYL